MLHADCRFSKTCNSSSFSQRNSFSSSFSTSALFNFSSAENSSWYHSYISENINLSFIIIRKIQNLCSFKNLSAIIFLIPSKLQNV